MEFRTLQQTDLKVSRLCFGTMTFGKPVELAEAKAMIARSIDAGINFFDTANIYQLGIAEEMLGQALEGHRDEVIVATKVYGKMGEAPIEHGLSKQAICHALEQSLRRLRTDYVDLYYLHQPDYGAPLEESLEAMESLVRVGKVRYPASSNYASWQVCRMGCLAAKNEWKPVSVAQQMYNLLARGLEQEFLPMAKQLNVSTIAYNPLAGGLLTGKHSAGSITPGTRFDGNRMYRERYWRSQDFEAIEKLKFVAQQEGRTLLSLALNWMLHHTPVDSVILGASRLDQLNQNLAVAGECPLSSDAVSRVDEIWRELRGPTPQYNR